MCVRARSGHCKSLSPEFAAAAAAVSDSGVRFGAVDATVHADLAQQFGVKGYPTIVSFKGGVKDSGAAAKGSPYNGGRTKADLVDAANALAETAGPRKGIVAQLTGGKQWAEVCGGKRICVLAVLPHILDDGAAKRLARVDVLAEAAGSISGSVRPMFTFLWSEIGAQTAVEGTLNVGMTPAVFAVSRRSESGSGAAALICWLISFVYFQPALSRFLLRTSPLIIGH